MRTAVGTTGAGPDADLPGAPSRVAALPVAAAIVLAWAIVFSQDLGGVPPNHHDEFVTLERSANFLGSGDWLQVTSNHAPEFRKPPLQYQLTAIPLAVGVHEHLAMRLVPFVFGILTLGATGLLAHALSPRRPLAVPAAVALLAGSALLVESSRMAMLDTGAAFFVVTTLAASLLSARSPRWWLVAGAAAGLGALQKTPLAPALMLGLAPVLGWVTRDGSIRWAALRRDPWFRAGALIAVTLTLAWPVIQTVQFGAGYLHEAWLRQIGARFAPRTDWSAARGAGPLAWLHWLHWLHWLLADAWLAWPVALVAGTWSALRDRGRGRRPLLVLLAIVAVSGVLFTIARGRMFPRYLLIVTPLLAAAGGVALTRLSRPAWVGAIACIVVATLNGPQLVDAVAHARRRSNRDIIAAATAFGRQLQPDEKPVFIVPPRRGEFPRAALLHYAQPEQRVLFVLTSELETSRFGRSELPPPGATCRGVSRSTDLDLVTSRLGPLDVRERIGPFAIWVRPAR